PRIGRQSSSKGKNSAYAEGRAAAAHDGPSTHGDSGDCEPDPFCGGHSLPRGVHGHAGGGREGQELPRASNPPARHRESGPDCGESAAGAGALWVGRDRPGNTRELLSRYCGNSRVYIQASREERVIKRKSKGKW